MESQSAAKEEPAPPPPRRVIAHCDIDAFYASVELLRRPESKGKPVVVAGSGPRSVVTTASYEARRFGIDSAMPAARARALCPAAIFIAPDHAAYSAKSREVWEHVRGQFERVQQVGVDEAYLDISGVEKPMRVLREMIATVREHTGMTVSVGVGPSRLVAKTVSASFKPAALKAMSREDACAHFAASSARVLQGVGPKTADRLAGMGLATIGDLQACDEAVLIGSFGERMGRHLRARAYFHDNSPLELQRVAKSRSTETTFAQDIADRAELEETVDRLARKLCETLAGRGVTGRNVAIKVRLDDWTTVTRARTLGERTNDAETVSRVALELFREYAPSRPVRLLGVRLAAFEEPSAARGTAPEARSSSQLALPL
ncbi:MAG: DNA polymerase IV [Solirubrobacteraceae bacterium]